jgi:hypothetical protein
MRREFADDPDLDVTFISILRTMCVDRACPVLATKEVPLAWDASRLTTPGSAYIAEKIMPLMRLCCRSQNSKLRAP